MIETLPQTSFSAGILSPSFFAHTDVDKYDAGLAQCWNFYVDHRGGVKNRTGFEFLHETRSDIRLHHFQFTAEGSDFVLAFRPDALRILQNGQYLQNQDGTVLQIATPWDAATLPKLRFAQKGLVLTITAGGNYVPRELVLSPTGQNWTLRVIDFSKYPERPARLGAVPSATGPASFVFVVTAVDKDGAESIMSRPRLVTGVVNYTTELGSVQLNCQPVPGAIAYRFYRSIIVQSTELTIAQEFGYIGESGIPSFIDNNIIPDFTKQPPSFYNPFAAGQVLEAKVTAEGSGYDPNGSTLRLSGPGEDFLGWPVIKGGKVVDTFIVRYGNGVTGATSFVVEDVDGTGSGAAVSIVSRSPADGNTPRVCAYYQQRRIFGASENLPNGVWGTHVDTGAAFDLRKVPLDADSFSYFLDIPSGDSITAMIALQDSLLCFHARGVDRLHGAQGVALTPNSAVAEPQTADGISNVEPVRAGSDIIYTASRGTAVNVLSASDNYDVFNSEDITVLASHLFGRGRRPVKMAWQNEPDRLLWVLREDGTMACCTYVKSLKIVAWSEHKTRGRILDIAVVREAEGDRLYLHIERTLQGESRWFIERMAFRDTSSIGGAFFVDCGMRTPFNTPATDRFDGAVHLEGESVSVFADGDGLLDRVVVDGGVVLNSPASRIAVGLPIDAYVVTVPMTSKQYATDHRQKLPKTVTPQFMESRGISVGVFGEDLIEVPFEVPGAWGDLARLETDMVTMGVPARWQVRQQIEIRQTYPLPASILGLIVDSE